MTSPIISWANEVGGEGMGGRGVGRQRVRTDIKHL